MRILYITRDLDDAGSLFVLKGLFRVLRDQGHEIVFLNLEEERRTGRSRDPLADPVADAVGEDEVAAAAANSKRRFRRFLYRLAPNLKVLIYDAIVSVRPQRQAMHRHAPDVVVVRASGLWNTPLLAKGQGIACLMHIDGLWEAETRENWQVKLAVRAIGPLMRRVRRKHTDHFAVVTEVVRDTRVQQGFDPRRFTVLDNGVDTEVFHPAIRPHSMYGDLIGKTVVGFVGSFRPFHQVDRFLENIPAIVRQDPSIVFIFIGRGPEWEKVRRLADRPEIASNVVVLGSVPHAEIPAFVAGFDIGLIPFTAYSCSPLKIYEYMAMGKATIAPRWRSVEAIIEHGEDGYLFEPEDLASLNAAVLQLAGNQEMRHRLGQKARLKMERQFTWKHCAERFRSACEAAISTHRQSAKA